MTTRDTSRQAKDLTPGEIFEDLNGILLCALPTDTILAEGDYWNHYANPFNSGWILANHVGEVPYNNLIPARPVSNMPLTTDEEELI